MNSDTFSLDRFVAAQDADGTYHRAAGELTRGRKTSHWMWFVFPQLAGLGTSALSRRFALSGQAEAQAYLAHPVLGPRLREVTGIVADLPGVTSEQVFGGIDAQKLQSSMTLFLAAAPHEDRFRQVLERWYAGRTDRHTEKLLEGHRSAR